MAIRLSGMASGLDTDSIVKELVSAYSTKKDKVVKKQTKLEWTQDAWKSMNTKIYSFYTGKLSGLRFSGSYNKKTASVSNSSVAKVTASSGAVNGTQELKVKNLATSGYLTGGEIKGKDGAKLSGSSKLSDIAGMEDLADAAIEIKVGGSSKKIALSENMTINQLVNKLKDSGVNASFDANNNRFFVSALKSGSESDFAITASNTSGNKALQAMGLFTMDKDSAEWAKYEADSKIDVSAEVEKAYEKQKTAYTDAETQKKLLEKEQKDLNSSIKSYNKSAEYLAAKAEFLNMDIKSKTETIETDEVDEEGNYKTKEITTYEFENEDAVKNKTEEVEAKKAELEEQLKAFEGRDDLNDEEKAEKASLENRIAAAKDALKELGNDVYVAADFQKMSDKITEDRAANDENLTKATERLGVVDSALDPDNTDETTNLDAYVAERNAEIDTKNDELKANLQKYYEDLQRNAAELIANNASDPNAVGKASGAIKITGTDAEIELNGATFKNSTNTFSINGLTIQATAKTGDEAVTITTDTDVDGIYDMIKDFFSSYNELIKSMDGAYNAASSKGYEPLTDDEKEAMTDSEVEKWEKKIKDALLRKDSTLGNLSSLMKNAMTAAYEVDGKKLSLASFGIKSNGYFASDASERGMYHIDGDADDDVSSGNADKLREAIAKDPDQVVNFFSKLSANMYNQLTKKMSSSTLSSAYTVYNDKQMKTQYQQYSSDVKSWEDKIKNYEDRYYKQFAAMEKALSSLNSQTSQLSGLFGG